MARPPESGPGNSPRGPVDSGPTPSGLPRRRFLAAALTAGALSAGGAIWAATRNSGGEPRVTPGASPSTGAEPTLPPTPSPTPDAEPTSPTNSMRVINGQVVQENRVLGLLVANAFSALNYEGCGNPSPVTSEDQREILQDAQLDGYNTVRAWALRNEGDPQDPQIFEQSIKNLVGHA